MSHFLSVFGLLRTQNLPKFRGHAQETIIYHAKYRNANFFGFGALYQKRAPRGAAHRETKPVF